MQELSLNVLDIAQNSVRAGARLIEIMVDEQPESDTMTITVADDGCGMTLSLIHISRAVRGRPFFRCIAGQVVFYRCVVFALRFVERRSARLFHDARLI